MLTIEAMKLLVVIPIGPEAPGLYPSSDAIPTAQIVFERLALDARTT